MTRELCIMACAFCRDPAFQDWAREVWKVAKGEPPRLSGESVAKTFIVTVCGIKSRNELDTNPEAAQRFHDHIRKPYLAWREQQ